jgi:hypothetical protein
MTQETATRFRRQARLPFGRDQRHNQRMKLPGPGRRELPDWAFASRALQLLRNR